MSLSEPTTTLTDYAIAIEAIVFAVVLWRVGSFRRQTSIRLWAAALGFVAIAASLGGTFHGSELFLEDTARLWIWQVVLYSLSAASGLMLAAAIVSSIADRWQPWWFAAVGIKFLLYVGWASTHRDFSYVVIDYLSAMCIVLILQGRLIYYRRASSARWIVAGIFVCFAATVVQLSGLTLSVFNPNDLYHIVQMVALCLFYRGARSLKDW